MAKLTSTQTLALRRLRQHGGTGVRAYRNCVLAGGVILRSGSYANDEPEENYEDHITWQVFERLAEKGCVTIDGKRVTIREDTK